MDETYALAPGGRGRGQEWGDLTTPVVYKVEEYMTPFNDPASRQQVFQRILRQAVGARADTRSESVDRILRQVQGAQGADTVEDAVYDMDWQYA